MCGRVPSSLAIEAGAGTQRPRLVVAAAPVMQSAGLAPHCGSGNAAASRAAEAVERAAVGREGTAPRVAAVAVVVTISPPWTD